MDEKVLQIMIQTVNLIESIILGPKHFKFTNHERMLSFLLDKLLDAKLSPKIENIFFKYLDQRKYEYHSVVLFLISKTVFNV